MDSYEQFFDQYVEFMKKYKDSGDSISMLADYTKMMQQYTDTMNKLNAIDQNSLSAADEAYYLEVMGASRRSWYPSHKDSRSSGVS